MRGGFSLLEMMIVLVMVGILTAMSVPKLTAMGERISVHSAGAEILAELATARQTAIAHGTRVAVRIEALSGRVTVASRTDTILTRRVGAAHHVTLSVTRDSIAYSPTGLGYGAANTRIIVRRGHAADTIFVSRLGRARR
jgi:prepilin-type N-terminal cleavage/methylation domain-containing protein